MENVEKRGTGKTKLALALSTALIIVLVVSNAWTYTNLNTTYQGYVSVHSRSNLDYDSLNFDYDSLNTTYQNYVAIHSYSNAEYDAYVANHHHTDAEYNYLSDIVNLTKSTVWIKDQTISQPAHSYTTWTPFSASYAGYVSVWVQTSTTTNTYVQVIYSAYGVNYDQQITVGTGGTAVFPILPCLDTEIRVGNVNLLTGATETVTITYHY